MKKMSLVSRLILLSAIMLIPVLATNPVARAGEKLRIGVVGLDFKGGHSARKFAAEVQKALVENLGKDARLSIKEIAPQLLERNRINIYENGAAAPAEVLKDTDLLLVAWVRLDGRMLTVILEFIRSDTGEILKKIPVHERLDYSIYTDILDAATGWVNKYLSPHTEAAQPPTTPPPAEQKVHARGVGMMPIQGSNVPLARRGSMVLAMRDAAERGLGSVIELVVVPETQRRDIVTSLSTRLMNISVVIDERQGDVYVTEIECNVVIPDEITKQFPAPGPRESTGMKPAIQMFKRGSINWETGVITARGIGRLAGTDARSIELARRAARVDAYAVALEIVQGMSFDPDSKVIEQIALNAQRGYRIRALVQGAEFIDSKQLDANTYQVTIEAPMRGLKGITTVFDDLFKWQPSIPPPLEGEPDPSPDEANTTGLIIDARGKGAMPAICPVIVDETGVVVYGMGDLPLSITMQRGAAAYTTGEPTGPGGAWLGPNPLRIHALRYEQAPLVADAGPGTWQLARLMKFLHPDIFLAQAAQTVALRQGTKAITVAATAATGPQKAKVVVSNSSAAQIKRTNKKANYLGQARVVIITDSMVGATEGRRIQPGQPIKLTNLE